MSDDIEDIKAELKRPKVKQEILRNKDLLSCGSTVLNLAVSGKARGAFYKGRYYLLVGDSNSGKTWLSLTTFAEASINPEFRDYRFIHDNAEDGALMDLSRYFGAKVNEKIEPPAGTRKKPIFSTTVEEFYYHIDDAFDAGTPFIYVIDSMDSLDAKDDQKKFKEHKIASRKAKSPDAKDPSGSYGTAKAKLNSAGMRTVFSKLKKSGSILIVISQAKAHIGFGFAEKSRSGGTSLKYYAHAEMWTAVVGQIKKKVNEKDRSMGIRVKVKVEKNRQTGRNVEVVIPIYWSVGLDDIGGSVDFLLEEGHWKKDKGAINAKEFGVSLRREELVAHVQKSQSETELQSIVTDVWNEIKEKLTINRVNKYGE